jgi:hypothetical protein
VPGASARLARRPPTTPCAEPPGAEGTPPPAWARRRRARPSGSRPAAQWMTAPGPRLSRRPPRLAALLTRPPRRRTRAAPKSGTWQQVVGPATSWPQGAWLRLRPCGPLAVAARRLRPRRCRSSRRGSRCCRSCRRRRCLVRCRHSLPPAGAAAHTPRGPAARSPPLPAPRRPQCLAGRLGSAPLPGRRTSEARPP